jgi:hypothetical protein
LSVVAGVHGTNTTIPAPLLAFVAFKLAQLLETSAWNQPGTRMDDDDATLYQRYLTMASGLRDKVVGPRTLPHGTEELWIKVEYNLEVCWLHL